MVSETSCRKDLISSKDEINSYFDILINNIPLEKEIKNLKLVNNDLLSENQELINKLISQEKEINKK